MVQQQQQQRGPGGPGGQRGGHRGPGGPGGQRGGHRGPGGPGGQRGGGHRDPRGQQRERDQEFDQKVLDIARVARVVAGGRRFSFRATVVIGDKKGRVGVGVGKGSDVTIAIGKAAKNAKKNVMTVPMTPEGTLPYDITGKQSSSVVFLKPAKEGRGVIAGGAVRTVCDLAGYKDIAAKVLSRSTNKLNMALATVNALEKIDYKAPAEVKKPEKKIGKSKEKTEVKTGKKKTEKSDKKTVKAKSTKNE
ncbi:MAG: hypothetical protein WDZ40_00510 [Candidatus Spechtbacterales bacterium]